MSLALPDAMQADAREPAQVLEQPWHEERFNRLAAEWKEETILLSRITAKVLHISYQKIIGMGLVAVPLILKDLAEKGPNHWFGHRMRSRTKIRSQMKWLAISLP